MATTHSASKITYAQACAQARQLKSQGLDYGRIAEHLRSMGYVSNITGAAVGPQAVRLMVNRKEMPKEDQPSEVTVKLAGASSKDVIASVQSLLNLDGVSPSTRLRLVKTLLEAV